jgi:hypothetical protein
MILRNFTTMPWMLSRVIILAILFTSCAKNKNETDPPPLDTDSLQISFSHVVHAQPLVLGNTTYKNAEGESFNITTFKYYLSNFTLTKTDGTVITLPPAYFLIDESKPASKTILLEKIPVGQYKSMGWWIGVDSTRNVSGVQSGALDPVNGMFWSWNSGYIMAKMEGTSPASNATMNLLEFHVGGFKGATNALRQVQFAFPESVMVNTGKLPTVSVTADVYTWFDQPNRISFKAFSACHVPGADAVKVADNYQHMFTIKGISN